MSRTTLPLLAVLLLALSWLSGCATTENRTDGEPPMVVSRVDLSRYTGTWYEIAKYPNRFQSGCDGATAAYALRADGRIDVVNRCVEDGRGGKERTARGVAKVVDPATSAKLSVTFFWPFAGDYWILGLGTEYEYAIVGSPDREYLWILSRTPSMDEGRYRRILREVGLQGFDPSRLVRSVHRRDGGR